MRYGNAAATQESAQAPDPSWRQDAAVGHRLPNGYMTVHAAGQRCVYCDTALSGETPRTGGVYGDLPIL